MNPLGKKQTNKKTWEKNFHAEGGWEGAKNGRLSLPQPQYG